MTSIYSYFFNIAQEFAKIKWISRKEFTTNLYFTIVVIALFGLFFTFLDLLTIFVIFRNIIS